MKRTISTVLVGLALVPAAVAQQGPPHGAHFGILKHDSNQDGQLTRDELQSALASDFASHDTDGDGTITVAERQAAMEASRSEAMKERFSALDTNSDGRLSAEEFSARPDQGDSHRMARQGKAQGPGFARGPGMEMKDISFEDFSQRRLAAFEKLDADGDQVVTQNELHAMAGKMRGPAGRDQ